MMPCFNMYVSECLFSVIKHGGAFRMVERSFGSKANWLTAPPEDEAKTLSSAPDGT